VIRQTNGRTDTALRHRPRLHSIARQQYHLRYATAARVVKMQSGRV